MQLFCFELFLRAGCVPCRSIGSVLRVQRLLGLQGSQGLQGLNTGFMSWAAV